MLEGSSTGAAMVGALTAGIPGAAVGAVASPLLHPAGIIRKLAYIEKLTKNYHGSGMESMVSDYMSHITSAAKTAGKTVTGAVVPYGVLKQESLDKHKAEAHKYAMLGRNPMALQAKVQEATKHLADQAPNIANALQANLARRAQFLSSKAPRSMVEPGLFEPKAGRQPSDSELTKFARYVRAANNPKSIIEDLKKGKLSQEGIETIKTLDPVTYQSLSRELINQAQIHGDKIPRKHRVNISLLLGTPADPTMRPDFLNAVNAASAMLANSGAQSVLQGIQKGGKRNTGGSSMSGDRHMTQAQRMLGEENV